MYPSYVLLIIRGCYSILPAVRSLEVLHYYTGDAGWVAGQAEIGLSNGKLLYVLDAFRVENGEIIE